MIESMISCQCCNDINRLWFWFRSNPSMENPDITFLAIVRVTNRYRKYMNECYYANYNESLQTFSGAVKTI